MTTTWGSWRRYLVRAGLVRNMRAQQHLTTFVVSAVLTVLITRLFLQLTGFPQIGGGGLHIAHLLPGGMLMMLAIYLLVAYVGPVVRPLAATVGGVGFGLFIDEVGKFVTSDNDYFFRPAAAIIYLVFVAIVLSMKFVGGRVVRDPEERLANVVDYAVEGVAGGLSARRLGQALELIRQVPPATSGRRRTEELLLDIAPDEVELVNPVDFSWNAVQRGFRRLAKQPKAHVVAVALLVFQAVVAPTVAVLVNEHLSAPTVGVFVGSLLSLSFALRGLVHLRRADRRKAVVQLDLAVQVSLLVTQVFQFAGAQFTAVGGMLLDLALLGLITAERHRLQREAAVAMTPSPVTTG